MTKSAPCFLCLVGLVSFALACGSSGGASPGRDAGSAADTGSPGDGSAACSPGLDPGLGMGGGIEVPVPPNPFAEAVALDGSGRILVLGSNTASTIGVARFNAD